MKRSGQVLYSALGLVALFLVLVAANFLLSKAPARVDLTDGKVYTLSPGTKRILQGLQAPVKLKLYASQGEAVPVPLRSFAQRVSDLVNELKREAGDKLVVERLDPKPDSEIEDAAQLDGIEPQQLVTGETFYLGASVSQLDRKQVIGALSPQRERLLEYDLVRAISRVGQPERPKVGVMAGLPVLGERFNPFTRQSSEPWVLASELRREFDVKEVPLTAKEIDPALAVLLVIHPQGIPPEAEYALDQFVLRGGKLVAFVDPYCYFDQGQMPGMPPQPSGSTLPTLFKAWGIAFPAEKVVSDVVFGSGGGNRYTPTVLSLNRTAFNRDDVVTSSIETLLYAFGGAFEAKPPEGLVATTLLHSSQRAMLVDTAAATKSGNEATANFQPAGRAFPLAVRLTGKFKTAFPEGLLNEKDKKPVAGTPQLRQSAKEGAVVLVADVDMLADGAAVDVQDVFGRKVVVPSNGNLAFALGLVEQFSAGDDLISLRSRAATFRPLTVVRELEANAQQQYFGRIQALEAELQKTTARMQQLQRAQGAGASAPGAKGGQIMTPEQQAELERFRKTVAETRLQLKEVRKNLRQDAEALVFWTKVANIAVMPILVALAGLVVALVRRRRAARGARPA
ncbi:MAG: GldG family protein [Betaproteobacteria bacterium]|nr:GldG family protein [Betaproteobacteria bacterium]